MSFTATIEEDEHSSIYELYIGFEDSIRRVVLNREELWTLKQEVDRVWFAKVEEVT